MTVTQNQGFTLVEILVAMVVLAIGLLGMVAITQMIIRKNPRDLTAATNICQLKMEELKDLNWDTLGSAADRSIANYKSIGLNAGMLAQEADLNGQGKTRTQVANELGVAESHQDVTALGPYKFVRTFVICDGQDYTLVPPYVPAAAASYALASAGQRQQEPSCSVTEGNEASRTEPLACKPEDITGTVGITNREKKIRILCSWTDRPGDCHSINLDTTVVKLQ